MKIATREMHASRGKFAFVILSVAIGVAALTGVRGFSSAFRATLLNRARSIMAADLSARTSVQPAGQQVSALEQIERQGNRMTQVTELLSMASAPRTLDPLLVSIKAVDPTAYPFYGSVDLTPAGSLASLLTDGSVIVADDLLIRLKLKTGDDLKIGNKVFRIAAVVTNEPDRLTGSFAAGPRVLMSRQGFLDSGLLAPGSRATQRYLFKVPPPQNGRPISDAAVADLKARLIKLLPEAQVTDYRESNPALTAGLDQATSILSLMSLVALVLGAIGVAMAMRAHLAQRLDAIAVMKALGARSVQIIKIYLIQTLLLGLIGGVLGVTLGVLVQIAFPYLLAKLVNIHPEFHLDWRSILFGISAGLLTTLLFTLPQLLDIRGVRSILILRRAVDGEDQDVVTRSLSWLRKSPVQLLAYALILGGLTAIAYRVSDSPAVGRWFSLGLIVVLAVLLAASFVVLRSLRLLLSRTRLQLPSALRHGLANLYRPGNPSSALLAAIGMGVMQIMLVFLMQHAVVQRLDISADPNLPNIFLIDIANDEIAGVRSLLHGSAAVSGTPELIPVVTVRITAIDGVQAASIKTRNFPHRMLQTISLTYSEAAPPGTAIEEGKWWTSAQAQTASEQPVLAVSELQARRIGVHLGSVVTFSTPLKQFDARVVALIKSDGQHAYSRADFIVAPKSLAGQTPIWYGGVHARPDQVGQLQRDLYRAYPTVTVINVAQALETIRSLVVQIIYVVQFLAGFSIFAGIIILASAIAGTRYRRIREVVILKALGSSRRRIITIFSIEFAVIGLVAGLIGVVFATLIVHFLLRALNIQSHVEWLWDLLGLLLTAVVTVATGWLASHRILGQKPLQVLREE